MNLKSLRAALACLALAAAATQAAAQRQPPKEARAARAKNEALRRELLRMAAEDQAARDRWIENKYDEKTGREMSALDAKHTARLREVFKEHGLPGARLVGRDGLRAFALMVVHSPSLEFQKQVLPSLELAARRGEFPASEVALLTDDVLKGEGKPQLYGTNFSMKDGKLVMDETQDPARLDERRAKVGLMPIAEYARGLEEMYKMPAVVPVIPR